MNASTTGGDDAFTLPYVRVYADDNGDTQFADEELPLTLNTMWEGRNDATTAPIVTDEVILRRVIEDSSVGYLHPAPARQIIIPLRGEVEVEITDGSKRRFGPGSIVLMDDCVGNGHISRWVGSDEPFFLVFKLPE